MKSEAESKVCVLACAFAAEVGIDAVLSPSRKRSAVIARMAAAVMLRERGMSLKQIGRRLGFRHHTTVMHYLAVAKAKPHVVAPIIKRALDFMASLQRAFHPTPSATPTTRCAERGCPMPAVIDGCCRRHWQMRHDPQPFEMHERVSSGERSVVGPVKVPLASLRG
jgi:DNA-binding CsgD family transcriptional regulator